MELKELAIKLKRKYAKSDVRLRNYYLVNINQPVMMDLYGDWLHKNGISGRHALSDAARYEFELSLLRPEVVERIASKFGAEKTASPPPTKAR